MICAHDFFFRAVRPVFGYVMAITWATQMLAISWIIVTDPANAPNIINAMASMSTMWGIGLSVLGIYVYKRSQEKIAGPGTMPQNARPQNAGSQN